MFSFEGKQRNGESVDSWGKRLGRPSQTESEFLVRWRGQDKVLLLHPQEEVSDGEKQQMPDLVMHRLLKKIKIYHQKSNFFSNCLFLADSVVTFLMQSICRMYINQMNFNRNKEILFILYC